MLRKHHQNNSVVKLVTRGKLSGQFCQRSFRKLPPLVSIPLRDIVSEQFCTEGHVCLGFTKRGRYILTYTMIHTDLPAGYFCVLHWWEFDLHRKLKLVRQVDLFHAMERDVYLSVCEWPSDRSKVVVFGFNSHSSSTSTDHHRLMNMVQPKYDRFCVFGITIVSNPPSEPCPHCSPTPDRGVGGCLEHGYVLRSTYGTDSPYAFQPAFQLKIDKVLLLKSSVKLEACSIYLCPAADCRPLLYTKRTPPPSSQEARYLDYRRRYYRLPQPGAAEQDDEEDQDVGEDAVDDENDAHLAAEVQYDERHEFDDDCRCPFIFTDLQGRELELVTGPRDGDGQTLCVEQLTLNIKDLIISSICDIGTEHQSFANNLHTLYNKGALAYDVVILEACPETNTVMMDVGMLVLDSEDQKQCGIQGTFQVRWELDTGLCRMVGGSMFTEARHNCNSAWRSCHRESCVTVMEVLAPENSSHHVNVMTNEEGELADADRCTRVLL